MKQKTIDILILFFYEAMGECGVKEKTRTEVMSRLAEKVTNAHEKEAE